jgi:hypothetical protein
VPAEGLDVRSDFFGGRPGLRGIAGRQTEGPIMRGQPRPAPAILLTSDERASKCTLRSP